MKLKKEKRWDFDHLDLVPTKRWNNRVGTLGANRWQQSKRERPALWDCAALFPANTSSELRREFKALAQTWQQETDDCSITSMRYSHPAFLRILTMGSAVVPWILEELKEKPDWWFEALKAVTGEDPTIPQQTFDEAISAWLAWGKINL